MTGKLPSSPSRNLPCGSIICAQVRHPSGRGRDIARFYLVISPTEGNIPGAPVVCLGISRQCPDPPPAHAELLPFSPDPRSRPMTGLRQRCAVFVDWLIAIQEEDMVNPRVGYVTQRLFDRVMEKLAKYRAGRS